MKKLVISIFVLTMAYISYAQDYFGSFEFDGYERQYEVYLPQDFEANMPLIVSIHGYSETVSWYKNYTFMHEVADTLGYVIVYPQGIGNSWNMGITFPGKFFPDTDDVGFISTLIDTMKAHYNIDTSRIYCCGFSWGGTLTYKLIGELGHRFAAFASVAGVMIENSVITCNPVRPFPIIHIHGTQDEHVPWDGHPGKTYLSVPDNLNFWLEKNSCSSYGDTVSLPDIDPSDGCKVEKISYTDCSGDGRIILYKIIGGGHSWPGTISEKTWSTEGNRNMDINANVEILNFFRRFDNSSVYIPDTAFLYALIDEGVDTNGDSLISYEEAEAIISLAVGDCISDMTGIEAFVNLEELHCAYNELSSLDVSNNTALVGLFCGGNSLTTLDVSSNPDLEFLSCYSNLLTNLDLSSNFNLIRLACQTNMISQIDVSNCKLLNSFNCSENLLTSLDVSNNSELGSTNFGKGSGFAIYSMPSLYEVCVWEGFNVDSIIINTSSSPNICFETDCDGECDNTDIEEPQTSRFRLFPNPCHSNFTIETDILDQYSVSINSLNGQLIFSNEMEGTTHQLELSSFQKGIYFITIRSKDYVTTRKIIKM